MPAGHPTQHQNQLTEVRNPNNWLVAQLLAQLSNVLYDQRLTMSLSPKVTNSRFPRWFIEPDKIPAFNGLNNWVTVQKPDWIPRHVVID